MYGFNVLFSDTCIISNNTAAGSFPPLSIGFCVDGSGGCIFTNNTAFACGFDLRWWPGSGWFADVSGNKVNGRPLGCFANLIDTVVEGSHYGEVILANCSHATVKNGIFTKSSFGVVLDHCNNCTLTNNTADMNYHGFDLLTPMK